ncbi:hypothetical protein [Maledivibacter halophilus]|uniref:hypothetical protein n=1 Tax=Maledivibacter halophilus TaxID=36842 RepID=UPI0009A8A2DD|nr:hypothetical protein [Maledivibacter halophilus]
MKKSTFKLKTDYNTAKNHLMAITYFQWAKFRSTKAGIKLHTKLDLSKGIPEKIIVSNAKEHDKTKMDKLMSEN